MRLGTPRSKPVLDRPYASFTIPARRPDPDPDRAALRACRRSGGGRVLGCGARVRARGERAAVDRATLEVMGAVAGRLRAALRAATRRPDRSRRSCTAGPRRRSFALALDPRADARRQARSRVLL